MAEDGAWDLDAYAAEVSSEPFRFRLGGREFAAVHMSDINWLDAAGGEDFGPITGHQYLKLALGDQWADFAKIRLPSKAYNELQRRWYKHCGVDLPELDASAGSSETGTAPGQ